MSIALLSTLLKHQRKDQDQPSNYFITYGEEGGLKMMSRNIKWPFAKGFHIYAKFYIDHLINEDMTLFSIATDQDDFLVIVSPEGDLKIKIFAYSAIIRICKLETKKWITFSLNYTLKSQIFRNHYDLQCLIDGTMYEKKDLPVPAISMTD